MTIQKRPYEHLHWERTNGGNHSSIVRVDPPEETWRGAHYRIYEGSPGSNYAVANAICEWLNGGDPQITLSWGGDGLYADDGTRITVSLDRDGATNDEIISVHQHLMKPLMQAHRCPRERERIRQEGMAFVQSMKARYLT